MGSIIKRIKKLEDAVKETKGRRGDLVDITQAFRDAVKRIYGEDVTGRVQVGGSFLAALRKIYGGSHEHD
jgi:hypothetical protein